MEKTVEMVMSVKNAINENAEMYNTVKAISFEIYKKGIATTADEINNAWTSAILAILYNENPQAREIINQEVYEAINQK